MNQDYSIPFRLSYLLGAKENKIKALFPNEYSESQSLKLFENYKDAKKLRMLCLFRNSVISDYPKYNKRLSKTLEGFQNITNKETSFLHNNEIKINKLFYDLEFIDYFNMLSELINILAYKVLLDMEVSYLEEISEYFNFPILTKNQLDNYVASALSIENPLNIFIYGCDKIKTTLKYSFNNNKNCIMSIFSVLGKSIFIVDDIPTFEFRTTMGTDLDESVSVKLQEVIEFYKGAKERRENAIKLEKERIEKEKEEARLLEEQRLAEEKRIAEEKEKEDKNNEEDIETVEDKVENSDIASIEAINFVDNGLSTLIVDCINTDFFTFVCFMHKTEQFSKIVLINDFECNSIWGLLSNILSNKIVVEKISTVKNNYFRNNLNTLLIQNICKNIYELGNKLINIVSNSTEYFDLFEIIEGVKFNIYTTNINDLPLDYLQRKLVNIDDISTSVDKFTTEWILNDVVNYAVFYYILNRPLYNYNEKEMLLSISENLSPSVSLADVKSIFYSMKDNIKINISDGNVKILNDKYCINSNK